ncbi:MAG: prephenate dehydratase [Actinobacteria bacterium]|nr:prephenate dehydratase [Actinomycetota bacterium]
MSRRERRIGYLGPPGTFSEEAARRFAPRAELVPCASVTSVLDSVLGGELVEGIVPVENSSEGSLGPVLGLLAYELPLFIRGEVMLGVRHDLLARAGTSLDSITAVLSHEQALRQCRRYLGRCLPGAALRETSSTAEGVRIVSGSTEPWAAIASGRNAARNGLVVLAGGIQDGRRNVTRFLAVGLTERGPSLRSKTTVALTAPDEAGALYRVLREFALHGVNLSRIESRPARNRPGDYVFFIDFDGHRADPGPRDALEGVAVQAKWMKVLGSYPAGL